MDYKKHYDLLIARAKGRVLDCYSEKHHIVPRFLGGDDSTNNLVSLTPEEHYTAHLLLAKIYPENYKLWLASMMMCAKRKGNKAYGWLRRRHADAMSKAQSGVRNSNFGKRWIHSNDLKKSISIDKSEPLPEGWFEGRKMSFDRKPVSCKYCGNNFMPEKNEGYCSKSCKSYDRSSAISIIDHNIDEIISEFQLCGSISKTLSLFGIDNRRGSRYLSGILKSRGFKILRRRNSK